MVLKSKSILKKQPTSKLEESGASASSNFKTPSSTKSPRPKSPARSRSPGRTRTPPRTKSPARTRSPARAKSPAKKSPGRNKKDVSPPPLLSSTPKVPSPKSRSPIRRKSPTRITKPIIMSNFVHERIQRPTRRNNNHDMDTDSDNPDLGPVTKKSEVAVRMKTRKMEIQVEKMDIKEAHTLEPLEPSHRNLIKHVSSQSSQTSEEEKIIHLKHFDKLGEFSDEDDTILVRKSESLEKGSNFVPITEFGGSLGALLLMFTFPLIIIVLHVLCNEFRCSFLHTLDFRKFLLFSTYFNLTSLLAFLSFAIIMAVLCVVPFGGKKVLGMPDKQGKFIYTMNGFFSFVVIFAIAVGLEIKNVSVADFIVEHIFHLLISSLLFGFSLTVYVFIRSFYVPYSSLNVNVVGKSGIYSFFMGREVSPRVFNILDLKMYMSRLTLIGAILFDFAYLYENIGWNPASQGISDFKSLDLNPTLLVFIFIHAVYLFDSLVYENTSVTSREIQYEGFGYIFGVGYSAFPFMTSAITKYIFDHNIKFSTWRLILATIIFLFGFIIYRGSNNQKDAYRKNPYDPALAYLETIPTTKGKKIICSGFWGIVRHPNYLGDIFMHLTFASFAESVPPVIYEIIIVLFFIHRSLRDNRNCKQKYGAAWDRYCNKVKYILIPKIY